jgi:hypothetical protein
MVTSGSRLLPAATRRGDEEIRKKLTTVLSRAPKFAALLCRRSCHQACPLGGTVDSWVPYELWRDSCTCPGADPVRQQMGGR